MFLVQTVGQHLHSVSISHKCNSSCIKQLGYSALSISKMRHGLSQIQLECSFQAFQICFGICYCHIKRCLIPTCFSEKNVNQHACSSASITFECALCKGRINSSLSGSMIYFPQMHLDSSCYITSKR